MEAKWIQDVCDQTIEKLKKSSARIQDSIPHMSYGGKYNDETENIYWWTNGFWSGMLWYLNRHTNDKVYAKWAQSCEEKLDIVLQEFYKVDHDAGFIWYLSAVADYKITGNEESRRRGLIAASFLASRFNEAGNFIRAWNNDGRQGWAIIDCMMNLPLLYWASEQVDDPRFKHIAMAHADMVTREFVRSDGSVQHIVCFDAETGKREGEQKGQGYSETSSWSRGTAWALYGLTLSYKYTKKELYKDTAKKVAKYFMDNIPEDCVPFADFKAPLGTRDRKDSTAGAIAASGLILLSKLVEKEVDKCTYKTDAIRLMEGLYNTCWGGENEEALLLHGNVAYWAKAPLDDIPIIYGDYYFLEALLQLKGEEELF